MRTLTLSRARRLALAAQGFGDPLPTGRVDLRHLRRVLDRLRVLQIDSVNVVARAHELVLFSRLGVHPRGLLRRAAYETRDLLESWAHVAAYLPTPLEPLLRPRQAAWAERFAQGELVREHPGYLEAVLAEVAGHGPLRASELSDPGERGGPWWGWAKGKEALEVLFLTGEVAIARRDGFTRRYDLAERVVPAAVRAAPTPSIAEAHRELLLLAAAACGVGTAADLCDYYRLPFVRARGHLPDLVAEGRLERVAVAGWDEPAYALPDARVPRRIRRNALLCPFDPVVWFRPRTERLFGFHYRIEIYVPAPKRTYGYYVFPFLEGERLTARVDLKADRATGRLLVRGAFAEPHAVPAATAVALAAELRRMAAWLDLGEVEVVANGDLAGPLAAAVG